SRGRPPKVGHPPTHVRLTDAEETALCRYIDRLDKINLAVRREFVREAANFILQKRAPDRTKAKEVGKNWISSFIKRYGYNYVTQKVLDAERQHSENKEVAIAWFSKLKAICTEEGIHPEDIWNMDETGFQIGVGKDQLVVTKRRRARYLGIPTNRESATAIE